MVLTELWWFQKKIFYIRMCKFIELLLSRQFMIKATDCTHYSVNSPLLYLMLGRELTKYMSMQCIVVRKYCLLMHNTHLCISVWNYFRRSILFMTIHFYKPIHANRNAHAETIWPFCLPIHIHMQCDISQKRVSCQKVLFYV